MFEFLKKQICFADRSDAINTVQTQEGYLNYFAKSSEKPLFLLKHSTRCPVSDWALTEFKLAAGEIQDNAYFVYLDLIAYREVSNFIAEHTQIEHQSPQLFCFKNETVIGTVTHEEVKAQQIRNWLNSSS